jgi:hypothetical protein
LYAFIAVVPAHTILNHSIKPSFVHRGSPGISGLPKPKNKQFVIKARLIATASIVRSAFSKSARKKNFLHEIHIVFHAKSYCLQAFRAFFIQKTIFCMQFIRFLIRNDKL